MTVPFSRKTPTRARARALIITAWLCSLNTAWASRPTGHEMYDASLGLASGEVVSIAEDQGGYIWVATFSSGVHRFNGERFRRFGIEDGLTNTRVKKIHVDRAGHVRVATIGGVFIFVGTRFERERDFQVVDAIQVNDLFEAADGAFWLATNEGAWRISSKEKRHFGLNEGLPKLQATALAEEPTGAILIGTQAGIARFENGSVKTIRCGVDGMLDDFVTRLLALPNGDVWMSTDQGIQVRHDGIFQPFKLKGDKQTTYVLDLVVDSLGQVRIATLGLGILSWNGHHLQSIGSREGLPTEDIWSLLPDSWGGLWVGTASHGLIRIEQGAFELAIHSRMIENSVPSELARTDDGKIWIATDGVGAVGLTDKCFEGAGDADCLKTVLNETNGLPTNMVHMVSPMTSSRFAGSLLLGTRLGPASWQNGLLTLMDITKKPFPVRGLLEADSGAVYVATLEQGLVRYTPQQKQWVQHRFLDGGTQPTPEAFSALAQDSTGRLWMGASGALYSYRDLDFEGEPPRAFDSGFIRYPLKEIPSTDRVLQIVFDTQDKLWFRSDSAIGIFDSRERPPRTTTRSMPRSSWLLLLSNGDMLVAAEDGLHHLRAVENEIVETRFASEANGFPAAAVNASGSIELNGSVIFGTTDGICRYQPDRKTVEHPIRLHWLHVGAEDTSGSAEKNTVELDVDAIAFPSPETVQLRYRMEGLSSEWSPATSSRHAVYPNLAPGVYVAQVQARHGQEWEAVVSSERIEILPAYWQTWWFRAVMALLVLMAALCIPLWRAHSLRVQRDRLGLLVAQRTDELSRHAGKLEQLVSERTAQLQDLAHHHIEQLESERRAIAHDLHDDVGQILGSMQMELYFLTNVKGGDNAVATNEAMARLQQRVDDISVNVRRALLRLRPRLLDELGLVPALDYLCESQGALGPMTVIPELDTNVSCSPQIALVVFRVAQESLSNAFAHSKGTEVKVVLRNHGKSVELEITDNGTGIKSEPEKGTRFGVLGMRERARAVGGTFSISQRIEGGTRIHLTVDSGIDFALQG
jgi:signal transduction histidine kinase/ligand-binding sensor domain-containing protein